MKSFQVFEGKTDCSLCHVGISNPKQLLARSQHASGGAQAQSAAEPNSNHFHTKSQRSVFKGEREKRDGAAERERRREAVARGGQWRETGSGEDREGEGEAHGARGAGGGEKEAGGERASELETRQRFMGREGSMAAPRWPAGRSGHVTRPGPRRPPSLGNARTRPGGGPGVMITRAGPGRSPGPHSRERGPGLGERERRLRRKGPFFPTRDQPAREGARRIRAGLGTAVARQPFPSTPPQDAAHWARSGPENRGPQAALLLWVPPE